MVNICLWERCPTHTMPDPPGFWQDTINFPVHMKNFNMKQLNQLCRELRADVINTVSKTGGATHLEELYLCLTGDQQQAWIRGSYLAAGLGFMLLRLPERQLASTVQVENGRP